MEPAVDDDETVRLQLGRGHVFDGVRVKCPFRVGWVVFSTEMIVEFSRRQRLVSPKRRGDLVGAQVPAAGVDRCVSRARRVRLERPRDPAGL